MKQKLICWLFALCMAAGLCPLTASAAEITASGTCGNNLIWTLDDQGTLTVSGTGVMQNYSYYNKPSWYSDGVVIKKLVVEEGVASIGSHFFYRGGGNLEEISLPNSLMTIGDYAFCSCTALPEITIPEGVTTIGGSAFHSCPGLTRVSIPSTLTRVGDHAFYQCNSLNRVDITSLTNWCRISFGQYTSNPLYLAHHLYFNDLPVTSALMPEVKDYVFYGCTDLRSVTIYDGAAAIGASAFLGCEALERVEIPDTVTAIGAAAFSNCGNLETLNIPYSATEIGNYAFSGCAKLGEITLPEGLLTIGDYAFQNCTSLDTAIPASVTGIGVRAFNNCRSLKDAVIPVGVTDISESAFQDCVELERVIFHDKLRTIGLGAFAGCSKLDQVRFPASITSIGVSAFQYSGLTSVDNLPSIETIPRNAFLNCTSLREVVIPDSVTTIEDSAFSTCPVLEKVTFGSGLRTIQHDAFLRCSSLTELKLPEGFQSFGLTSFLRCSGLTDIYLPESLTYIAERAFANCDNIKDVWYAGSPRQWDEIDIGSGNFYLTRATLHCAKNPIPPGTYCLHAMDENGASLKGAVVTWNEEVKTTDQAGCVYFSLGDEPAKKPAITASCTGRMPWNNNGDWWTASIFRYEDIILYPETTSVYRLRSAQYSNREDMSLATDLLTRRKVVSLANTGHLVGDLDFGNFYLRCEAMETDKVSCYELWQADQKVASSSDGNFGQLSVNTFRKGGGCFVRVVTEDGAKIDTAIQLEFRENPYIPATEFSYDGLKLSLQVDEDIPFVGGNKLEFDMPFSVPACWVCSGDKIMVGINYRPPEGESIQQGLTDYMKMIRRLKAASLTDLATLKQNLYRVDRTPDATFLGDTKIMVAGYLENNVTDSRLSGEIVLIINPNLFDSNSIFHFEYNAFGIIIPIPFTVQVGIDASMEAGGEFGYQWSTSQWSGNLFANPSLGIQVFGGVGYSTVAAAGIYGSGQLDLQMILLGTEPGIRSVDLTGELGIKAYIGPVAYEKAYAHKTWSLYAANRASLSALSAEELWSDGLYDASRYQMADLGYLAGESPWLGGGDALLSLQADGPDKTTLTPLLTGTYRNARPVMAAAGDKLYAAFVRADGETGARYVAVSRYDGTAWSDPVPIDESAVLDDAPVLCADESGCLWLAYARTDPDWDGTSLTDYAKQQEIVVGRLNGETLALTDTRAYPGGENGFVHLQKLAVVNGTPVLAWAESGVTDENSVLRPETGAILCASFENGAWGDAVSLTEAAAEQLAIGSYQGTPAVAFAEDGVLSCVTAAGDVTQLAEDMNGHVTYGVLPGTEAPAFLWNDGDALVSSLGAQLTVPGITNEYAVTGSSVYYSAADGGCANLFVLRSGGAADGVPIRLTGGAGYLEALSAARLDGEDYIFGTHTTPTIGEDNVTDDKDLVWSKVMPVRDLRLDSITYDDEGLVIGEDITVTLTVTNAGEETVTAVDVCQGETPLRTEACTLEPGESKELTVTLPCPDSLQTYDFSVAEPGREDCTPEDNTNTVCIGYADVAARLDYQQIGTKKYLLATVTNEGVAAAEGTLSFLDKTGTVVYATTFDGLSSGASAVARYALPDGGEAFLDGDVSVQVSDVPNELYTFNNQSTIYLPASRYSVESISVSGTAVTAEITCGDTAAAALCASYSPEGKMLSIDRKPLSAGVLNEVIFTHAAGASRVKVFVVDETGAPLCVSRELQK